MEMKEQVEWAPLHRGLVVSDRNRDTVGNLGRVFGTVPMKFQSDVRVCRDEDKIIASRTKVK